MTDTKTTKALDLGLPKTGPAICWGCFGPKPEPGSGCATCEARHLAEEVSRREIRAKGWFSEWAAAVPTRYLWATEPSPAELPRRCRQHHRVLARSVGTVALLGKAGCGKTAGAVALVSKWVRDAGGEWHRKVRKDLADFAPATQIDELARQSRLGDDPPERLRDWGRVPVLVLDDLGTETTFGQQAITSLIQRRHDDDHVTVFTSGLTSAQIHERYGSGVARRVLEAGAMQLGGAA